MKSKFTNLIDLNDLPVSVWNEIITLGEEISDNPEKFSKMCDGKIMATLFYEPSTRTQMSFQAAMFRLGGKVIGFDNPATSSVAKGECLKDTTKIVSSYSDIMVMRHPLEGSAKASALTADCPIINAGDGGHLHPTQTLTDLLTLKKIKGTLENLTIGLCGDLKHGRTVHSLCKALSCYKNNKFVLISTKELSLPFYIKDILNANNCEFTEVNSIEEAIPNLDLLYMTRIQRERFASLEEYNLQKNVFCLDTAKMRLASKKLIVLHPLPRVDEIEIAVDDDKRALYFDQSNYGMYVLMALILTVLKNEHQQNLLCGNLHNGISCDNPNCITNQESYLPKYFTGNGDTLTCEYCDERKLKEF